MQGLKSNIRYWGYTLEYMLLVVLGTLLLICVMTGFDNLSNLHIMYLEMISDMGVLYILLMMCMLAFSGAVSYLPFTLSMGSTRKNSFLGMQIVMHFMEVQLAGIVIIAKAILGKLDEFGKVSYMVILLVTVMFLAIAIGNFISAAVLRFSRTVGFIVYFGILALVAIGFAFFVGYGAGLESIRPFLSNFLRGPVVLIALALDALSIAVYYRVVRKLEVRV